MSLVICSILPFCGNLDSIELKEKSRLSVEASSLCRVVENGEIKLFSLALKSRPIVLVATLNDCCSFGL